ncbi:MAG: 3D domain-containing protein [Actinomycetes bacterium]
MRSEKGTASCRRLVAAAVALGCLALAPQAATAASSGGATPGTVKPPTSGSAPPAGKIVKSPKFPIASATWLDGFYLTEYWSAPERWYRGERVSVPGLSKKYRVDFLYSATGVAMQGDGLAMDGTHIHMSTLIRGYVTKRARPLSEGAPYWSTEYYWLNSAGEITFPLEAGGWSNGPSADRQGKPKVGPVRAVFATGPSLGSSGLVIKPLRSIAVDPKVVPYRSAVWLPAYNRWFCAADTGGAIKGRHFDVFRSAPATRDSGNSRYGQTVYVLPPAAARLLQPLACA